METQTYNNFFRDRTVLITGGAGFIGSSLASTLVSLGANVRVLDDFSTGHKSNVEQLEVEVFEGSILDEAILQRSISGCDCIFSKSP